MKLPFLKYILIKMKPCLSLGDYESIYILISSKTNKYDDNDNFSIPYCILCLPDPLGYTSMTMLLGATPQTGVQIPIPSGSSTFGMAETGSTPSQFRAVPGLNGALGAVSFELVRDPR